MTSSENLPIYDPAFEAFVLKGYETRKQRLLSARLVDTWLTRLQNSEGIRWRSPVALNEVASHIHQSLTTGALGLVVTEDQNMPVAIRKVRGGLRVLIPREGQDDVMIVQKVEVLTASFKPDATFESLNRHKEVLWTLYEQERNTEIVQSGDLLTRARGLATHLTSHTTEYSVIGGRLNAVDFGNVIPSPEPGFGRFPTLAEIRNIARL